MIAWGAMSLTAGSVRLKARSRQLAAASLSDLAAILANVP